MSNHIPTKTSFKNGYQRSIESKLKQAKTMKGRINKLAIEKMNTPEANAKKSHKGSNHPRWIKDRTKLKQKRCYAEEQWFFKEIIKERNFRCELSNKNGKLSVHHIKPVWKYPEERFNKNNCIVILLIIHKKFHYLYGSKGDELNWCEFIIKKEYESI
jgi:hypothetical protein